MAGHTTSRPATGSRSRSSWGRWRSCSSRERQNALLFWSRASKCATRSAHDRGGLAMRPGLSSPRKHPGWAGLAAAALACSSTLPTAPPQAAKVQDAGAGGDTQPVEVAAPLPKPVEVQVGATHVCARMDTGTVACWGDDGVGQTGAGNIAVGGAAGASIVTFPAPVVGVTGATALAAGAGHTCALEMAGTVRCWGANAGGQLGNGKDELLYGAGKVAAETKPTVAQGATGLTALAAGDQHTCGVRSDGFVLCWGRNDKGQLGRGDVAAGPTAAPVKMPPGVRGIALGGAHACAAKKDGTVQCWGAGAAGQLGSAGSAETPTVVTVEGVAGAAGVAAGALHTCAWLMAGGVQCWGANANGQLGAGDPAGGGKPVTVPGLANVVLVVAGADHTCALDKAGQVRCWGANGAGQVGVAGKGSQPPVAVAGLGTAVQLAAGGSTTCARSQDDQVLCWGARSSAQFPGALPN
ncbi:MAG: hypothetical protein EXR79_07980, partial [Myxococcales bacterium]|nr:hypothetical protein [Myxococcales bacterium]